MEACRTTEEGEENGTEGKYKPGAQCEEHDGRLHRVSRAPSGAICKGAIEIVIETLYTHHKTKRRERGKRNVKGGRAVPHTKETLSNSERGYPKARAREQSHRRKGEAWWEMGEFVFSVSLIIRRVQVPPASKRGNERMREDSTKRGCSALEFLDWIYVWPSRVRKGGGYSAAQGTEEIKDTYLFQRMNREALRVFGGENEKICDLYLTKAIAGW